MKPLSRRKALTVVAAAPAAVAMSSTQILAGGEEEDGELAALIRRYFAQVEAFNSTYHETDEESDAHADATYQATVRELIGVPARTREDALAAFDFLVSENADFGLELGGDGEWDLAVTSLVAAIRCYLEGRVA